HFNDFFTRSLKLNARPIADSAIICPVDGAVSQVGAINNTQILQAKGRDYSVEQLLGNDPRSAEFSDGFFTTIYLSPKDYHRIHMPYDGKLISMDYIPGDLFSVNQQTAQKVDNLFARNERVVCYFETEFGLCAFVLVGAIFVGSMQTVWHGQINPPYKKQVQHFDYQDQNITLKKGEEMGRFNMGSTIIMLSPNQDNPFNLSELEVVQMGQALI
ncbi:MAG TPA: phosphatidylserine decarboxylase, partial [Gammaproteobacteria bacterium]|nr:phosphatidylserine decarboxylase [Gammaproteobacteria bacterium]